jgi:hypothetical protein
VTTLNLIADLDDNLTVSPADLALLAIAEQHASDDWHRREQRVASYAEAVCVICGGPDGPECAGCTAGWDHLVDRASDL